MNYNQETLWKSEHNINTLTSFRTRRWVSSDQLPNNLTETFWQLKCNVKYLSFLEYKKLELFLVGISDDIEQQMLFDAPGVLNDNLFIDLLRAKRSLQTMNCYSQEQLLRRLAILQTMLQRPIWNKNLLYTLKGNIKYEIQHIRVAIRKVKKFSGWVRNSSAVGSKSKSKIKGYDPEIDGVILDESLDYYHLLVTPELDSNFPGDLESIIEAFSASEIKLILSLKSKSQWI